MLNRLDAFLLKKAQKFCDTFQRLTGFTKFRIQKWVAIAAPVFYLGSAILRCDPFSGLIAVPFIFSTIITVLEIEDDEDDFFAERNPRLSVTHNPSLRIVTVLVWAVFSFFLPLFIIDGVGWPLFVGGTCFTAWVYVTACVPRPPGKSKVREWLEKGLQKLNSFLPEPAPIPIPSR